MKKKPDIARLTVILSTRERQQIRIRAAQEGISSAELVRRSINILMKEAYALK